MTLPADGRDPAGPYSTCDFLRGIYQAVRPAYEAHTVQRMALMSAARRAARLHPMQEGLQQAGTAPSVRAAGSASVDPALTSPERHAAAVQSADAHGKVILLGEHAVVYGAPAVALAVPGAACRAEARLRTQPGPGLVSFRLHSDDGPQPLAEGAAAPALHTLVDSVLRRAGGQQARGVELTVFSGIPPGCGMGSSAACARACAVALARLLGLRLRPQDVFELVQEAEQVSHGRASGIDAHATGSPGLLVLRDGVPSIVEAGRQAWLVVADSGTASSTRQAVEMLGAAFTRNPVRRRSFLARSRRLTADGLDALTSGRPRQLGRALTGTHTLLMEQGLVNGPVRSLVDVALAAGALGAKMTGGGLGGCALALAGTPAQADLLAHRLRGHGARRTWTVPLVQGGG